MLALLFTTYPLAPAAIASLANGAESDWLTTRIKSRWEFMLDAASSLEAIHHWHGDVQ